MKYYSEDDVMDLIREAEDCERAYEWGEGHRRIHFEDYHPIEIPDKHGRLGDLDLVEEWMRKKHKDNDCPFDIDAFLFALRKIPTVLEATISND